MGIVYITLFDDDSVMGVISKTMPSGLYVIKVQTEDFMEDWYLYPDEVKLLDLWC